MRGFLATRIKLTTALIIAVIAIGGLELVIGYANDYKSCRRTAETKENTNLRVNHASAFWESDVAGGRDILAGNWLSLYKAFHHRRGRDAELIASFALAQANANMGSAADFRAYADQLRVDLAPVPDCSRFPPPTE